MYYILPLLSLSVHHAYRWRHMSPSAPEASTEWLPCAEAPPVSFLVPAWKAADDIPAFVAAYERLSYPNRELILCAGGPDGSFEVAQRFEGPGVIVLEQLPGEGKQGALYKSYGKASGSIIYLTDIDCRPHDGAVNNLLRHLRPGSVDVVTGPFRPLEEQMQDPMVQVQWAVERVTQPQTLSETEGILGSNAALVREAVDRSGAFSIPAPSGTDYTLAKEILRAGYTIRFVPGHPMPTSYAYEWSSHVRRQSRWIRNVYVLGTRYGAICEVREVQKTVLLPYLLLGGIALGRIHRVFPTLCLLVTVHAILNRLRYQHQAGLAPNIAASAQHFLMTQMAALHAGKDILLERTAW